MSRATHSRVRTTDVHRAARVTEGYTIEQFRQLFEVNLFGVVRVNRAVLPSMRSQRSGLPIHVSSGAAVSERPRVGMYCASKFALEALAGAYRFELSPFGVDSVVVEPGFSRTPIVNKIPEPAGRDNQTRIGRHGRTPERGLPTTFFAFMTVMARWTV